MEIYHQNNAPFRSALSNSKANGENEHGKSGQHIFLHVLFDFEAQFLRASFYTTCITL